MNAPNTVIDDLMTLYDATFDERDRARIAALVETLRLRQKADGYALSSKYTPAFKALLKRERQRQKGASA